MKRKEFVIKVEVNVKDKEQRADVIIHTSAEAVKQAEWRDVETGIIETIEKELKKQGRGSFKIVARVEVEDKKTEDKKTEDKKTEDKKTEDKKTEDKKAEKEDIREIFNSLSLEMLRNPKMLDNFFKGFTPEGLKKAEEIVLSSDYFTPAELIKKAKQELNGADLANFIARVPLITEVNKAIGAGIKGSGVAALYIALILAQLTPENPTELNLKKGTDILKIILTADTQAVMDTTSVLLDVLKKAKDEED